MLLSAMIGALAALVAAVPRLLHAWFPAFPWNSPWLLVALAFSVALARFFWLRVRPGSRPYDGIADLFVHVHDPANPESSRRWAGRAFFSLGFSLLGGLVGREGAASEFSKAVLLRRTSRASRWSESRRRTDAAVALAAGVSAALGAPVFAILLVMELGLGGRLLNAAAAALAAQFSIHALSEVWPQISMYPDLSGLQVELQALTWRDSLPVALAAAGGLLAGAALIRLIVMGKATLGEWFRARAWMTAVVSAVLLGWVGLVFPQGLGPRLDLLEQVLGGQRTAQQVGMLALAQLLLLVALRVGIGTMGIVGPVFALGGFSGWAFGAGLGLHGVSASALTALVGATAALAVVLDAPLAATAMAMELSGASWVLLPCGLAAFAARTLCRKVLRTRSLILTDLEGRGFLMWQGRSREVLDRLRVRDAMVTDHETVEEHETVTVLHEKLMASRYPFLPVVDRQGRFLGVLTLDLIEEAWESQGPVSANSPLAKLLEARDLLYRSRVKTPTATPADPLTSVTALFEEYPCVPVLDSSRKVAGLLFVHNVRLAYDREMGRAARLAEHFQAAMPPSSG